MDTVINELDVNGTWNIDACDILPVIISSMYIRPVRVFSSAIDTGCILDFVPDAYDENTDIRLTAMHLCLRATPGNEHYDAAIPNEFTDSFTDDENITSGNISHGCSESGGNEEQRPDVPLLKTVPEDTVLCGSNEPIPSSSQTSDTCEIERGESSTENTPKRKRTANPSNWQKN